MGKIVVLNAGKMNFDGILDLSVIAEGTGRELVVYEDSTPEQILERSEDADAIEELSKPKWIPVTERLPDNIGEEVLVCNEDYGKSDLGFATVAVYNGNGWLECWDRKMYLASITHWMPLPEPPEKEK